MNIQIPRVRKRLPTQITNMGPLSCMTSYMIRQRNSLRKLFTTHGTHMRLQSRMRTQMTGQSRVLNKRFTADFTRMRTFTTMDPFMDCQVLSPEETFAAIVAFERTLP